MCVLVLMRVFVCVCACVHTHTHTHTHLLTVLWRDRALGNTTPRLQQPTHILVPRTTYLKILLRGHFLMVRVAKPVVVQCQQQVPSTSCIHTDRGMAGTVVYTVGVVIEKR